MGDCWQIAASAELGRAVLVAGRSMEELLTYRTFAHVTSQSRSQTFVSVRRMTQLSAASLLRLAVLLLLLAAVTTAHNGSHHKNCKHGKKPAQRKNQEYCKWKGSVCHDPVLVGADGQQFYFHGHKDADFCLVSDPDLHINAHFIGRRGEGMPRDFTWVQSLGIVFGPHQLYVGANKVSSWDEEVDQLTLVLDNAPIVIPTEEDAAWEEPAFGVSISRLTATNSIAVVVEGKLRLLAKVVPITQAQNLKQKYGLTPDNCFAHLEINFQFYGLTADVAGVLGQTYGPHHQQLLPDKKPGQLMPTLGGEHKFLSSGLMSPDCPVARFGKTQPSRILTDLTPVACSSENNALVCRR